MKKIICLFAIVVFLIGMAGCKSKQNRDSKAYKKSEGSSISTQVVAKNGKLELSWEDDSKTVQMKNLQSGKIWSNIPREYYMDGGSSSKVNSTINIAVSKSENLAIEMARGYDSASAVECIKIKNGLRVTYFFDGYEISIPVEYVLKDDHVETEIDVNDIAEGSGYKLLSIEADPFFCTSKNNLNDSYLFVPVGSGTLMYTDETVDKVRDFSGEVYGLDATAMVEEYKTDEEKIRLPVYGAKDGNDAIFCIINEGAGSAVLNAEAGNSRMEYSNVGATFYVRGYDTFPIDASTAQLGGSQYKILSDYLVERSPKISYYPLSGKNANYAGMANCYREYLEKEYGLTKENLQQETFGLDILGGTEITTTIMGIPRKETVLLTNFQSAANMIKELNSTGMKPSVRLMGYADSGILPGKICGGYGFLGLYGKEKDRLAIDDYCKLNHISLFYDFDLIRFSKSGGGFTKSLDSARTPSARVAQGSAVWTPLRSDIGETFDLLKREKLSKAASLLQKFAEKKKLVGLSLHTFGEMAYSDYSKPEYEGKGDLERQSREIIEKLSTDNCNVSTGSNLYAAVYASSIYNVPVDNGNYLNLSQSIPFYQMVFRGIKPIYSQPVNTVQYPDKFLVDCVSSGTNITFSVIANYEIRYSEKDQNYIGLGSANLYGLRYDDNKKTIKDILAEYSDVYQKIGDSYITDYVILSEGISFTKFSNGVELYANHTDAAADTPVGKLDAYKISVVKH